MADEKSNETDELTPFERFENFARKLIAVPKHEIDEQEEKSRKP